MALRLINRVHHFEKPDIKKYSVEIDKEIYNDQASVVLSGIKMSFNDNINQELQQLKARITNVKTHVNSIDYMIEFDFRDIVGNVGEATINVLIVADVK